MGDVRFTKALVTKVAEAAKRVTGGVFVMRGPGMDIGHGVRYIDGKSDKVWFGPDGAREACAYYIGGILGWMRATGGNVPDDLLWIRDVQDAYSPKQRFRNWEIQGRERAARESGRGPAMYERYSIKRDPETGLMIVRFDGVRVGSCQTETAAKIIRRRHSEREGGEA